MEEKRDTKVVLEEIKAFVTRENFLNYGAIPSETPILDKAMEFSARHSNGHHFRDLITGFFWGYQHAREEMMKDAVVLHDKLVLCYDGNNNPMGLSPYEEWWTDEELLKHFGNGDKVKIIIMKE